MEKKITATPRGCDSARVEQVIVTRALKGAGTENDPCREVIQYWTLDGELNLKKIAYYLGIALCLASPLAFGICMLIGLDNTVPLSLMITSNACRICSLEAEMTENTMRSDKAMKMYKVTTVDQYSRRWVHTVFANSKREAMKKVSVFVTPHETLLTIEEVD